MLTKYSLRIFDIPGNVGLENAPIENADWSRSVLLDGLVGDDGGVEDLLAQLLQHLFPGSHNSSQQLTNKWNYEPQAQRKENNSNI